MFLYACYRAILKKFWNSNAKILTIKTSGMYAVKVLQKFRVISYWNNWGQNETFMFR